MGDRGGWKAAAALVLNAGVWGLSWWPFRELQALGLHPLWATGAVYLLSIALLLAFRPRTWGECGGHAVLWLLGAVAGLTNVGFNWAVAIGDVVRVVLLFYLMPAWSMLLAWPLLGERPTPAGLLRLLLALAGVAVVLDPGTGELPLPREIADWLAIGAGFCFAFTNVLLRKLEQVPPWARVLTMFVGGLVMAWATALAGWSAGLMPAPMLPASGLGLAVMLGLAFLGGNIGLQYGAARLPAAATSLIMLSEIIFASVSSVALGAAGFSPRIALGAGLILLAAFWACLPERPRQATQ
jgi:drug/metabolite transporter (DMT)-like permease